MTIQTLEIAGERYVVLPEKDFQQLQEQAGQNQSQPLTKRKPRFAKVTPLKTSGTPASEILIRDRR